MLGMRFLGFHNQRRRRRRYRYMHVDGRRKEDVVRRKGHQRPEERTRGTRGMRKWKLRTGNIDRRKR